MAGVPLVILDLEVTALAAEVLFNGVAISRSQQARTLNRSAKINGWTLNGANTLSVRLGLPTAPRDAEDGPEPAFELRLRRALPGGADEADDVLVDFTWQAAAQPLAPGVLRPVLERTLQLTAAQPWSWTRGYAFTTLTPQDRDGIVQHLMRLQRALADRQIDEVVRLQSVQVGEQATALGQPADAFLASYRDFLGERMGSADWRVAPLDAARLRIEGMADGRIQHVTDADGGPPLVSSAGESRFAIDPYLSKIDGAWTIVR